MMIESIAMKIRMGDRSRAAPPIRSGGRSGRTSRNTGSVIANRKT